MGDGAGCIRPLAVSQFCSLSPTIDAAFGEDSTVGERAGVRGRERAMWPPHPSPLPRNTSSSGAMSIAGERGQAAYRQWANAPDGEPRARRALRLKNVVHVLRHGCSQSGPTPLHADQNRQSAEDQHGKQTGPALQSIQEDLERREYCRVRHLDY